MQLEVETQCSLCQSSLKRGQHRAEEGEMLFCCKGCQVVYQILVAQGALLNFKEHPVYLQALQAGLITNPELYFPKDDEKKIDERDFQKLHLVIENMWCPSCAQVIHLILMRERGVRACYVDYATDLASIEFTPLMISKEKILKMIRQLGYHPLFLQDPKQEGISRSLMLRFIVATFFSLNIMMFAYPIYATYFDRGDGEDYAHLFAYLSMIASLPVIFYSAWPIWKRLINGLKVGIWGMEALVGIGVAAATSLSFYELYEGRPYVYFDSITVIIMFVLLGKILESKAKFSAKDALMKLTLALPRKGRKRYPNGEDVFVSIKEILPGDCLVVCTGEKIVLDGCVQEGSGVCDESFITGESLPVPKEKGACVVSGTILQQGFLLVKVSSSIEDSTLQQIINMVSHDIGHKSKYVRASDKIVKWFVPFVVAFALAAVGISIFLGGADPKKSVVQTAIIKAISILLISCPCAIGIAAPLAEAYILNAMAKLGVLVRNRGCLPFIGQETLCVFDKTGTVTEGRFNVCSGLESLSSEEKMVLKGLVAHSIHPIAVALYGSLLSPSAQFEKIEEVVGNGIRGVFCEKHYSLGSSQFFKHLGIEIPPQKTQEDESILTTVYFAKENVCLSVIQLGDKVKPGMRDFIQRLSPMKTLLLSGDCESAVKNVAAACAINEWRSGYHPLQKKELIDTFRERGEIIAMVGDGVNDAPALAASHVAIAVFSASDFSIQVSDLLLTTKSFDSLINMRKIAIKGRKIIKQNLFWAFFYNCLGLGVAAAGFMTPIFAAFAMVASSLIVLLNAQRISLPVENSHS